MSNEPEPANFTEPPPGRYGNVTVLPAFVRSNIPPEESTWPQVRASGEVVLPPPQPEPAPAPPGRSPAG